MIRDIDGGGLLGSRRLMLALVLGSGLGLATYSGCVPGSGGNGNPNENLASNDNGVSNSNANDNQSGAGGVVWGRMFDGNYTGALVSIWGSAPTDVFAVGGQPTQGEAYHFDGTQWQAMELPSVPILASVYGFASNDVYAVGEDGGIIHYDGSTWSLLIAPSSEDLWSIWGSAANDIWIVGGDNGDDVPPVILHYNGVSFTNIPAPANDRNASSLYGVWGVEDRVWAVGSLGLIIERAASTGVWAQVPLAGPSNQDYLSISGTSVTNVIAVGGNPTSGARIARYDGNSWDVTEPSGVGGLSVVYALGDDDVLMGGPDGYVGVYDPSSEVLFQENAGTFQSIRGIWSEGLAGKYWVVGAIFSPNIGAGYLRTDHGVERLGEQPDVNDDGFPDAPLTIDGRRPDEIIQANGNVDANLNGNVDPGEPAIVVGIEDESTFTQLMEGDSIPFTEVAQPPNEIQSPSMAYRVSGFPDSALNQVGTFEYSVTAQSDGTLLATQQSIGLFQATESAGIFIFRRGISFGVVDPSTLEGREVVLNVTINYDAVTPSVSATFSGTFTLVEQLLP